MSYGSGAKDTTRLAASNPDMWVDILLYNRAGRRRGAGADRGALAELRRLLASRRRGRAATPTSSAAQAFRKGIER